MLPLLPHIRDKQVWGRSRREQRGVVGESAVGRSAVDESGCGAAMVGDFPKTVLRQASRDLGWPPMGLGFCALA